ncbi:hypothetical protein [uncultured Cellulomonas sp.]|nr:hypothetical protein [uncultured Cellulomonas sp.]
MMGSLLVLLLYIVVPVVVLVVLYWTVRLAVRDGMVDAHARTGSPPRV